MDENYNSKNKFIFKTLFGWIKIRSIDIKIYDKLIEWLAYILQPLKHLFQQTFSKQTYNISTKSTCYEQSIILGKVNMLISNWLNHL